MAFRVASLVVPARMEMLASSRPSAVMLISSSRAAMQENQVGLPERVNDFDTPGSAI